MPYLTRIRRSDFYPLKEELENTRLDNPGELVYVICLAVETYLGQHLIEFARLNDVVGAFESAKMDFIRNVLTPYEVAKQSERGDVWSKWGLE